MLNPDGSELRQARGDKPWSAIVGREVPLPSLISPSETGCGTRRTAYTHLVKRRAAIFLTAASHPCHRSFGALWVLASGSNTRSPSFELINFAPIISVLLLCSANVVDGTPQFIFLLTLSQPIELATDLHIFRIDGRVNGLIVGVSFRLSTSFLIIEKPVSLPSGLAALGSDTSQRFAFPTTRISDFGLGGVEDCGIGTGSGSRGASADEVILRSTSASAAACDGLSGTSESS